MPMIDYMTSMKNRGMMNSAIDLPPTQLEALQAENNGLNNRIKTLQALLDEHRNDVDNLEHYLKNAIINGRFDMSDAYEIAMMFDLQMTKTVYVEIISTHRGTIEVPLDTDEGDLEDCIEADLRTLDPIMNADLYQEDIQIVMEENV